MEPPIQGNARVDQRSELSQIGPTRPALHLFRAYRRLAADEVHDAEASVGGGQCAPDRLGRPDPRAAAYIDPKPKRAAAGRNSHRHSTDVLCSRNASGAAPGTPKLVIDKRKEAG